MASVNSRSGLFPSKGRGYSPTAMDENMSNDDIELQLRTEPQKPSRQQYENINDREFTEDASHQYEEPDGIRDRNREVLPGPSSEGSSRPQKVKKAGEDRSDGYHQDSFPRVFKILAFVGFLFALASLIVVVLYMAGVIATLSCRQCQLVPGQDSDGSSTKVFGSTQKSLWDEIKELKSNVSELNAAVKKRDAAISKLKRVEVKNSAKIAELERKANYRVFVFNDTTFNISSFLGPHTGVKGDNGFNGKTGKTGPGNMTLCRYMSEEGVPFTADRNTVQNVIVTEPRGYRIIGATCSTLGTAEYNLRSEVNSAKMRHYECECRGKSSLFAAGNGRARCIMHYWMCASYY